MDADEYFETIKSMDSKYDNYFAQDLVYFGYDGRDTKSTHYTVNDGIRYYGRPYQYNRVS